MAIQRDLIEKEEIASALCELERALCLRLGKHGYGRFAGPHECYGVIAEEFTKELTDALHANDRASFRRECIDIAVAAMFSYISMDRSAHRDGEPSKPSGPAEE